MKITDYEIVTSKDARDVANKVNVLLQEGWELRGKLLHADIHSTYRVFVQVMVKKLTKDT